MTFQVKTSQRKFLVEIKNLKFCNKSAVKKNLSITKYKMEQLKITVIKNFPKNSF